MLDTSLQPDLWKEQVHPWKQLQSWCPQPLAGSAVKGKGSSAELILAPRSVASGGWPGAGLQQPLPGLSPPAPLLAPAPLAQAHLAPSPWHGWWAGGLCCCDLAPSRLLITRGRQPKEWSRSLKCNLWLLGIGCRSPRPEAGWPQASCSPSDAHEVRVPLPKAPAPKNPLTAQPVKPAFLRQLAHS